MTKLDDPTATGNDAVETPYTLDAQIGYLLRLANQRHALIFQELSVLDLTPTQFSAMVRLLDEGECSQNELGRRTAMDVATIKGVVDRLRSKGLVTLNPDPNDRRRTTISAAGSGEELRATLHHMGRTITERTLAPLTRAERKTLLRLLSKLT
ncbi:MAG: winged helix-turn-helix transcriptional regulator [Albidovulum sp.]|jgi:DNA-binding MarR family transcriptional regulator|uniref:MarR family winged helix-turn-helix transcriptional regulator n=1 Tax=Albidovulum sp. TaxID=1872424 RepID=UPI00132C0B81|nr:MarR family winged helix-turn-helix transcriptional regulator [Defluviimonas sp.]KAB2885753.1 MAG: winged helix-turn-helix transcriptional regulator [Defluviimonas sp.]